MDEEKRRKYRREYMRAYRKRQVRDEYQVMLNKIKRQVNFYSMDALTKRKTEELLRIVAELMCLDGDETVYIDGVNMKVKQVQNVYKRLRHDHVTYALERYEKINTKVVRLKEYIRTLLYNTYFELEPYYLNEVNREKGGNYGEELS